MTMKSLAFEHERNSSVRELGTRIHDCIEGISLDFEHYDDEHVRGPGIYLAIVATRSVEGFAEPMGSNTWPIDICHDAHDVDAFHEAASTVAYTRDGGVCVGVEGTVLEQMVRFKDVRDDELPGGASVSSLDYADWMGARHMSAYATSLRPDVITTITLSEETGRVTTFRGGNYETLPRSEIGVPWRGVDPQTDD